MRIWDIDPLYLNGFSLLAEHRELHGCYNIVTGKSSGGGYVRHPETVRWYGRAQALKLRHDEIVAEMLRRFNKVHHATPIPDSDGLDQQNIYLISPFEQVNLLLKKYYTKRLPFGERNLWSYPGFKGWFKEHGSNSFLRS